MAKIVVVDDSPTQRTNIALTLGRKGHQVVQGGNGLEAITLVQKESPDLLVSDIMMPELNGYQVCRLLKNDPSTEDLPIILLTTLDHQEHRFWGREAGADSYVLKSADSGPLEKEVVRLLQEKKRLPEEERQRKGTPGPGRQRAQTRLTDLLDRLLFEATVSNRIREIGRFTGNFDVSLQKFFEFFEELIDYQIAVLCQRSSAGPLMVIHLRGSVPAAFLESAKQTVKKEGLLPGEKESIQQKLINPERLSNDNPPDNATLAVLSVPFSTSLQEGGLAVFSTNAALYTEETTNTLKIAAQELEPALRFILQADALEKLKEDFGAMIVHDLRSPLNTMMSSVSMMGEGLVGALNEEQNKWLARIQESGQKMMNLINDFLDLSKLEAGKIDLVKEEVDLKQLIQNSLDTYGVLAQDKKISLSSRVDAKLPSVIADPRRLDQVLTNLLSNAVKFTAENGTIEVGANRQDGQETRVWVKDSGVGIAPQELALVFEKYRQTTSGKTSKHKGTGLGLMICKMIVEAHGGRIWVESEMNKGTTFLFSLPLPTGA